MDQMKCNVYDCLKSVWLHDSNFKTEFQKIEQRNIPRWYGCYEKGIA